MQTTTRRQFLIASLAIGGSLTLAACGGNSAQGSQAASGQATAKTGGAPRWGMTAEQETAWQQIEAAADKEGTLTYYGQNVITPSVLPTFMDLWKKSYPNIKIDLVNGTTSDVQTRISTEQDAKTYVGDVGDISVRSGLLEAQRGYSQKFIPPASQDPTVKFLTERIYGDGAITNDHQTWFPLWINTKLIPAGQEPKTHLDLIDPKWKGKILWYAPWAEGGGWIEYYQSKKMYGMDWVNGMIAQKPAFAEGSSELGTPVARGEYSIALGGSGSGATTQLIRDGQPIKAVWLDDFVQGVPSGHLFINHAPHPNAAKVFLNWWISETGQTFQANVLGQFPVRADIAPKEDWQKGVSGPKAHINNADIPDAEAQQAQKEAGSYFKQ